MAFRIDCVLEGYEYRGTNSGVSEKTGNTWVSLVLESPADAAQVEVSVPAELQGSVMGLGLRKGDEIDAHVVAVSSQRYSFVRLLEVPTRTLDGADMVAGY